MTAKLLFRTSDITWVKPYLIAMLSNHLYGALPATALSLFRQVIT